MTLRLSMLVEAATNDAKRNIDQLSASNKRLTQTVRTADRQTQSAQRSMNWFQRRTNAASTSIAALRARLQGYTAAVRQADDAQELAAGSVANMTAQFNDIGVMMAAGQNPVQLALQQGTQITQIFGNRGAAGAVQALRAGLVSVFSPLNLITIGSIAAGAAMFQWLTSSSEEAEALEDSIDGLIQKLEEYQEQIAQTNADLRELYGEVTPQVLELQALGIELDGDQLEREARVLGQEAAQRAIDELSEGWRRTSGNVMSELVENLVPATRNRAGARNLEAARSDLQGRMTALSETDDLDDQLTQLREMITLINSARDANGDLNETQSQMQRALVDTVRTLMQVKAASEDAASIDERRLAAQYEFAGASQAHAAEALAAAQAELAELQQQIALREAIARSGEDSLDLAELRLKAERDVNAEYVASLEVAEDVKDMLLEAWDNANGIASVDMAGNISLAADEAHRLMVNLINARAAEIISNVNNNPDFHDPRGESPGAGNPDYIYQDAGLHPVTLPPNARRSAGRGGGGRGRVSEIEREQQAVQALIDSLQEEVDITRESDPVQREMIRLREQMAGATAEQRDLIGELVQQRVQETLQIEAQRDASEMLRDTIRSSFDEVIFQSGSVADAFDRIKLSIIDASIEALSFGQGPLAGIFGTQQSGGWLGGLLGFLPGFADGGYVSGPGTSQSDSIAAFLSDGEFVVNAGATAKYRDILEAMNTGRLDIFTAPTALPMATHTAQPMPQITTPVINFGAEIAAALRAAVSPGGPEFNAPPPPTASGEERVLRVTMEMTGTQQPAETEEAAYRGMKAALEEYDRIQLPVRFNELQQQPWKRG